MFFGELCSGNRFRYKVTFKVALKHATLSEEVHAQDRTPCRNFVMRGVFNHEREFIAKAVEKLKRHR